MSVLSQQGQAVLFPQVDLSRFNEADVQADIVEVLLRYLGYRTNTENDVIRQQPLRYDKSTLGRKNPERDWPLRGRADYICEAHGRVQWTIEAKSPGEGITLDDIEQAYTYAVHPEVRAVYFCLCDGHEFRVYQTLDAPRTEPLVTWKYENLNDALQSIENVLGPEALVRDFPRPAPDTGRPIGPGLKSLVRIGGGHIVFKGSQPALPMFTSGYTVFVTGGAVQRDDAGRLLAWLNTRSPYEALQRLNERLGLAKFEIGSEDTDVSTDEAKPTIFQSSHDVFLAKGEILPNPITGIATALQTNLTCKVTTAARGVLRGRLFSGMFQAEYRYLELRLIIRAEGAFEMNVA
jgi:hypothetical protein